MEPYLIRIYQAMLRICAIIQQFVKNKYILGSIRLIVSNRATDNGYIFDWVVSVIVGIYVCRYIVVHNRDKLIPRKNVSALISALFIATVSAGGSGTAFDFPNSLLRNDVSGLMVVTRPQQYVFALAAHYGLCVPSNITQFKTLWHCILSHVGGIVPPLIVCIVYFN